MLRPMEELPAELLIEAYLNGLFPMACPNTGDLEWYRPDPRAIIEFHHLHVSKSLMRTIRSESLRVSTNTAFTEVLEQCAAPAAGREDTWIDQRIASACIELHGHGLAHSVEAWRDEVLVGGLYGVQLGGAFFGESMFSRPEIGGTDASKVCLVWLVNHMQSIGAELLDVQFLTPHLERLGATEIPNDRYQDRRRRAVALDCCWHPSE